MKLVNAARNLEMADAQLIALQVTTDSAMVREAIDTIIKLVRTAHTDVVEHECPNSLPKLEPF